jgi:hypothetical protein
MNDSDFLSDLGITPDPLWLIEQNSYTPEQQQYVLDLLRINMLLGGGLRITLKRD